MAGPVVVVAEKPKQARRLREAFKRHHISVDKVVAASGHIYELRPVGEWPYRQFRWVCHRPGVEKRIKKQLAGLKPAEVVIATDYDREGSAVGYNILRFTFMDGDCGELLERATRMHFSTLTLRELAESFRRRFPLVQDRLVYAGLARAWLDAAFGFNLSVALQKLMGKRWLSMGRVQGPTLMLVYKRWQERENFRPEQYWFVQARLEARGVEFTAEARLKEKIMPPEGVDEAEVVAVDEKPKERFLAPFNLEDLQAEAARLLNMRPYTTQTIAQKLYMCALVSYPRTDSQRFRGDSTWVLNLLSHVYPIARRLVGSKPHGGAKDDPAHPCIYPTGLPEPKHRLNDRELALWHLIAKRFLAAHMPPLRYYAVHAKVRLCEGLVVEAGGWHVLEPGFAGWYPIRWRQAMPRLAEGDKVKVLGVHGEWRMTQPPPQYTQAMLVKRLAQLGIGTKSTRAPTISKLIRRHYLRERRGRIGINPLGRQVVELVSRKYPDIVSPDLTRQMETWLDEIARGKLDWRWVKEKAIETSVAIAEQLAAEQPPNEKK